MQKRMRKAFTLLELIVVVVVLGILALVAVPAFSGVINNSTASVAENTAKSIARDANALAAFNSGASANVTSTGNIECALLDTTLSTGDGWATDFDGTAKATITLRKNNSTETYVINVSNNRAVVGVDTSNHAAAGTVYTNTAAAC